MGFDEFEKFRKKAKNNLFFKQVLIGIMIAYVINYWDGISEIIKIEPNWKIYLIADFAMYGVYVILSVCVIRKMTPQNIKTIQRYEVIWVLPSFGLGCWGFSLLFSPGVTEWEDKQQATTEATRDREQAFNTLLALILLRVGIIWITLALFVLIMIFMAIIYGFNFCFARKEEPGKEGLSNKLSDFLKSRARRYDPSKAGDIETNECVICFEEFSKDDKKQLVELNCNNKHIFHEECIQQWISKPQNTTCPLCREEINTECLNN